MNTFRHLVILAFLVPLAGCDLYLPGCGSDTTLGMLRDQALNPFDLGALAEIGMISEVSRDLRARERACQTTIQPKADFSERYSEAKRKFGGGKEENVLGMIGRALVSAALPDRLETVTIQFKILRDERTQGFGVAIDAESMDKITSIAKGYKLADIAIDRMIPKKEASPRLKPPSEGEDL